MTTVTKYDIMRSLELNNVDECEACTGYYNLIELCEKYLVEEVLTPDEQAMIAEIVKEAKEYISEEFKHTIGLRALIEKFTGIVPEK